MITFLLWTYVVLAVLVSLAILLFGLYIRTQWGEERLDRERPTIRLCESTEREVGEPGGLGQLADQRAHVV